MIRGIASYVPQEIGRQKSLSPHEDLEEDMEESHQVSSVISANILEPHTSLAPD